MTLPALADQIKLMNGDVVSGSIEKKDGDKVTLKSEFLGEVTIPWAAVASISSDAALTVVGATGTPVNGRITSEGANLVVAGPQTAQTIPLAQVNTVRNAAEQAAYDRLQHPSWLELWNGQADLGYALARGNSRTSTLTTSFDVNRTTKTDRTEIFLNQIYSTGRVNAIDSTTANAIRGGWLYAHDITPRLAFTLNNTYEHDELAALDLRFVAGLGLSYAIIKTDNMRLDLLGGIAYNHEKFTTQIRNSAEAYAGDDWKWTFSKATNSVLTQSFRVFPNLTTTGEYRMNFDIDVSSAVRKWLAWHVTASDRFLSNPVPGHLRNDVLLSTGFRVTFAR
jgi:putative salt-induced outer membrane protein YdiY